MLSLGQTEDFGDLEFACGCSPESRANIDRVWAWTGRQHEHAHGDRLKLVGVALYMLGQWGAEIGLDSDQWHGMSASNNEEIKIGHFSTYTQCDDPVDGLIYTYKRWWDHYQGKSFRDLMKELEEKQP